MKLKEIRIERGLSVPKLAELSGVPRRTIQDIEKRGDCMVSTLLKLSKALGTTTRELVGWDDEVSPISKGVVINILDRVATGIPIEAVENIIDTEEITEEMAKTGTFFGLRIQGDSMEPDIHNGDTVIVRQQDDAENDEIVIALINRNDRVCKRLKKYENSIALVSLNANYEPLYFSKEEIETKPVQIIGKVIELRRKL